jgi:hypothetical protein
VREITHTDLTELEGEPTARADVFHDTVNHSTELRWLGASIKNTSSGPAHSSANICSGVLQLSITSAICAAIIGGVLGGLSAAPGWLVVTSVLTAFATPILAGVSLLFQATNDRPSSTDPTRVDSGRPARKKRTKRC